MTDRTPHLVGGILVATALFLLPSAGGAQTRSIFSVLDTQGRSVAPQMAADGALTDGDVLSAGGRRVQVWSLSAAPGAALQVDLRSADFDSFLYVVGPGLGEGMRDDDGGEGLNSRLCMALSEVGEYRLVASSLSGETGNFTLEVSEVAGAENGTCPTGPVEEELTDLADLDTEGRTLSVGDDIEDLLQSGAPSLFDSPVQAWAVNGRAGDPFSVDLVSDDFDAYLFVEGPGLDSWLQSDDEAGRCDARITFNFPESGTYRVVVSTLGTAGGRFRLIAGTEPGPVNPESCIVETPAEDSFDSSTEGLYETGMLSDGGSESGAMTGSDQLFQSRSVQVWLLDGSAGDQVAIEMRSADFDSYLSFAGPGFDEAIYDDDGAGNLHSRLCVELPETGVYQVLAGPLSGDQAGGRYTLTNTTTGADALCDYFDVSPAIAAARLANISTAGRSISVDGQEYGELETGAMRHPDSGYPIQAWSFQAPGSGTVFLDVVSEDFDPLLYAVGPGIVGELFNDDFSGADGCNTRLEIGPNVSGPVTLLVGSFQQDGSGSFFVRASTNPPPLEPGGCGGPGGGGVTSASGATTTDPTLLASVSSGGSRRIAIGTEMRGSLGTFEESLTSGQPAQAWSVEVDAGDELVIELVSDEFDPVLYLDGAGLAAPLMDDDGMGVPNSRIEYAATSRGRLRIVVSAFESGLSGNFRLRVIRSAR